MGQMKAEGLIAFTAAIRACGSIGKVTIETS